MTWRDHASSDVTVSSKDGALLVSEAYWPYGVLKISLMFIPIGFYWSTHDIPTGTPLMLFFGFPLYVVAAFGVADLFRRRTFSFYPKEQRVEIVGFSLRRGRVAYSFSYSQVGAEVVGRWVLACPIHKRYFAMLKFPGIEVAYSSSPSEELTGESYRQLLTQLELKANDAIERAIAP